MFGVDFVGYFVCHGVLLLVCHGMSSYLAQMSRDIGMALYISTFAFVLCVGWNLSKDLFIQISNYNASNRCLFLVALHVRWLAYEWIFGLLTLELAHR